MCCLPNRSAVLFSVEKGGLMEENQTKTIKHVVDTATKVIHRIIIGGTSEHTDDPAPPAPTIEDISTVRAIMMSTDHDPCRPKALRAAAAHAFALAFIARKATKNSNMVFIDMKLADLKRILESGGSIEDPNVYRNILLFLCMNFSCADIGCDTSSADGRGHTVPDIRIDETMSCVGCGQPMSLDSWVIKSDQTNSRSKDVMVASLSDIGKSMCIGAIQFTELQHHVHRYMKPRRPADLKRRTGTICAATIGLFHKLHASFPEMEFQAREILPAMVTPGMFLHFYTGCDSLGRHLSETDNSWGVNLIHTLHRPGTVKDFYPEIVDRLYLVLLVCGIMASTSGRVPHIRTTVQIMQFPVAAETDEEKEACANQNGNLFIFDRTMYFYYARDGSFCYYHECTETFIIRWLVCMCEHMRFCPVDARRNHEIYLGILDIIRKQNSSQTSSLTTFKTGFRGITPEHVAEYIQNAQREFDEWGTAAHETDYLPPPHAHESDPDMGETVGGGDY